MPVTPKNFREYVANGCGRCEYGGTPQCKVRSWTKELESLAAILQESDLTQEMKWSAPCYTHGGKNILMLAALKECVALSFFRGAELEDPKKVLEKPGKNSRFARYILFTSVKRITQLKPTILSYAQEAIDLERSGQRQVPLEETPLTFPDELTEAFATNAALKKAFYALTPGRQRGYLIYFSSAKQSKTRTARIEKYTAKILAGKGWNER